MKTLVEFIVKKHQQKHQDKYIAEKTELIKNGKPNNSIHDNYEYTLNIILAYLDNRSGGDFDRKVSELKKLVCDNVDFYFEVRSERFHMADFLKYATSVKDDIEKYTFRKTPDSIKNYINNNLPLNYVLYLGYCIEKKWI